MRAAPAPINNVFSIESFMDELGGRGRRRTPSKFPPEASRRPPRARRDRKRRRRRFGWQKGQKPPPGPGGLWPLRFRRRYKNLAAYCAIASEVEVNRQSGRPRLVRRHRCRR